MFSHIMVGANDIEASKIFYDAILGVLGAKPGLLSENLTGQKRYMYFLEGSTFLISEPIDGNPSTHGNGSTVGFNVPDEATGNIYLQFLSFWITVLIRVGRDYVRFLRVQLTNNVANMIRTSLQENSNANVSYTGVTFLKLSS